MPEKESDKIEIRSDEVQDILGMVPSWIVSWGTVVIFITVLVILAGSWLFRYPDIKRADITVTTENPPATLMAKADGQIESLFVHDSQFVEMNTHLAVIENPADYTDVISLEYDIEELRTIIPDFDRDEYIEMDNNYTLGEIQPAYAEFIKSYQDYYNFLELDYYALKIASLEEEIRQYELYYERLEGQSRILRQQYALAERQFDRDSTLYADSVFTDVEYEKSESNRNEKEYNYEESRVNMSSTEIEISRLGQEKQDLQLKAIEEKQQQQRDLLAAFEKLNAEIGFWEQNYLLKAPIAGVVSFTRYWSETQNVRKGDKVLTVIPAEQGEIIGKIDLPVEGSGKVKPGQRVNIKFTNFPHLEYGMVRGIIRSISLVPDDREYSVEVYLPDGLVTYYGIDIPFNQEMLGRAEIITDDRRLMERIISPVRSIITEQRETR